MKILRWCAILLVIVTYLAAESLLRRRTYDVPLADNAEKILNEVPDVLREPIRKSQKLQRMAEEAEAETDPVARANRLYRLGGEYADADRRWPLWERICAENPTHPVAARARAELAARLPGDEAYPYYREYLQGADVPHYGELRRLWSLGLGAIRTCSKDARMQYVAEMAEARVIGPGFADAYEELRGYAARRQDAALLARAREFQERCQELEPR